MTVHRITVSLSSGTESALHARDSSCSAADTDGEKGMQERRHRPPARRASAPAASGAISGSRSGGKIRLVPIRHGDPAVDVGDVAAEGRAEDDCPKPASFAKTLTQSNANHDGGFSVPRFCIETIFSALDYSSDPPLQSIIVRDVHGLDQFPNDWRNFVNQKKLLVGDSIVFLSSDGGEVHVGVRHAKGVFCDEGHLGWDHYRGLMRGGNAGSDDAAAKGKAPAEDVVAAVRLAADEQPFETVFDQEVGALIAGIFEGIKATVFAHGATGSGKTYMMQGRDDLPGLIPLSVVTILAQCTGTCCSVEISYYEVYM
ncbi:auxin response factor 8-like [Hordeum vulgare]|nr:auxin response factor 8-like [Hordeum vulgare]